MRAATNATNRKRRAAYCVMSSGKARKAPNIAFKPSLAKLALCKAGLTLLLCAL